MPPPATKKKCATFSPARLHYAIFSVTTNSRRTASHTRRARFHAAPECHAETANVGTGFRFHYNPPKRPADWLISRPDNGNDHSPFRSTSPTHAVKKKTRGARNKIRPRGPRLVSRCKFDLVNFPSNYDLEKESDSTSRDDRRPLNFIFHTSIQISRSICQHA